MEMRIKFSDHSHVATAAKFNGPKRTLSKGEGVVSLPRPWAYIDDTAKNQNELNT